MTNLLEVARHVGRNVAALHADDVDKHGRFPQESVDALKETKLLSAYVPKEFGGFGANVTELMAISEILGTYCASTAMLFAMHQIQLACIVHHAKGSKYFQDYLRECVQKQLLIASMTSEVGVGGNMRTSLCSLEKSDSEFRLVKDSTTMSYGAQADDILVTCRSSASAPGNDQVLVLVRKADAELKITGNWDTMGLRGTCSPPCHLTASGQMEQVFEVPFTTISSQTMVPFSHMVWGGCWLGTAQAAVKKARAFVRSQALKNPGVTPPAALRLAELMAQFHMYKTSMEALVSEYALLCRDLDANAEKLSSIGYAFKMNNMKISGAEQLPLLVQKAFQICGVLGYKNDSKYAMSRHLRDSFSAGVMVGNERILATNSAMVMVLKDNEQKS